MSIQLPTSAWGKWQNAINNFARTSPLFLKRVQLIDEVKDLIRWDWFNNPHMHTESSQSTHEYCRDILNAGGNPRRCCLTQLNCRHCNELFFDHSKGKCAFHSTWFSLDLVTMPLPEREHSDKVFRMIAELVDSHVG